MKSKIFNTDQIRAIQDGRMTQFMQVVKHPLDNRGARYCGPHGWEDWHGIPIKCPFGKVGDILYCREAWHYLDSQDEFVYKADPPIFFPHEMVETNPFYSPATMPREAARLFLRITNIRVMRVQELTEQDAKAQGYEVIDDEFCPALCALKSDVFEKGLDYFEKYHWIIDFEKTDKP